MRKSRLSWYKQERLIEYFVGGATARCAAKLVRVNKDTAAFYFHRLRALIATHLEREAAESGAPLFGEVEVDESYFGGVRKGKRRRRAAGKAPVFGIVQRGGRVYTQIIPDAKSSTLMPIIERKVIPDSIVYSDCWRGYNTLDVSAFTHLRINYPEPFADKRNHINSIENFWSQAKRHMQKFNGIPREHFGLYLKECEWRFNHRDPKMQFTQLKQWARETLK